MTHMRHRPARNLAVQQSSAQERPRLLRVYSEQFRSILRTCGSRCGRVQLRQTKRTGRKIPVLDTRRRAFITLLGGAAAAWPLTAGAQQRERTRRIGVLSQGSIHSHPTPVLRTFLERLHELGWIENQSLLIDWRFSEGSDAPLAGLAADLVGKKVEVIVTAATQPTIAAKSATSTIPIVFVRVVDPLLSGVVKNLARPEANVTGISSLSKDIAGKRLALFKETLPDMKRISVLWIRSSRGAAQTLEEIQTACQTLGIDLQDIGVSEAAEFDGVFDAAVGNKSTAVVVLDDSIMEEHAEVVTRIAAARKLPLLSTYPHYVINGGFMSYGPDLRIIYRRGAEYVDRILRGDKPAILPIELPTKFALVINLKTAKALGLAIPDKLLALADEVIE
jgi:putative ABC transport system substrate-binding protein